MRPWQCAVEYKSLAQHQHPTRPAGAYDRPRAACSCVWRQTQGHCPNHRCSNTSVPARETGGCFLASGSSSLTSAILRSTKNQDAQTDSCSLPCVFLLYKHQSKAEPHTAISKPKSRTSSLALCYKETLTLALTLFFLAYRIKNNET